ncbi:hypothetical protein NPIL_59451 [Nephila pilipes]|uniref:Uncharacterized protein n=1 Tax=Nephila pilipes TaxID=299642 RepID=A0A8X6QA69_NEPPI|nr:hypothetical protein NPIL_59451 [Nephila pilipes]
MPFTTTDICGFVERRVEDSNRTENEELRLPVEHRRRKATGGNQGQLQLSTPPRGGKPLNAESSSRCHRQL